MAAIFKITNRHPIYSQLSSHDMSTSSTETLASEQDLLPEFGSEKKRRQAPKLVNKILARKHGSWVLIILSQLIILGIAAIIIYFALLWTVPSRYTPKPPVSGVNSVVDQWRTANDSLRLLSPWKPDLTKDITPMACHSHNDYNRPVPLFEALAAGCIGVEADIWVNNEPGGTDLLVGHSSRSLQHDRTLQTLYIQPLLTILDNLSNASSSSSTGQTGNFTGIFQSSPATTLTLLLDFKSNGAELWPYVMKELEILRSRNYLTHWSNPNSNDNGTITWAPIIVVASGDAPFDLLTSNTTYRDIFYDAPLADISNPKYDSSNSYYASTSMAKTIGHIWFWKFSAKQMEKMKTQVAAALEKGLKPRYWGTPSMSVRFRNYIWGVLVDIGVGMLNVDDFGTELFYPLVTRFGENRLVY